MAVPMKVRVRNRYRPTRARSATPKAMSRAKDRNIPPTSSTGRSRRTVRWSVVHRKVAKDCRKNRSPPVARSWLMGALARMGEMIRRCTPIPRRPPRATAPSPASQSGQPWRVTRKYTPYMQSMTRST